jgi:predicted Co/Zn/Cd cation transporter (cation efflux family)
MLGKPQWFKRRKYGGWGFCPASWQGWIYLAVLLASFTLIQLLPMPGGLTRTAAMLAWAAVFSIDAIHIMVKMPRDERERIHEAVAERNALWAMVTALAAAAAYQFAAAYAAGSTGMVQLPGSAVLGGIDPFIIAALFVGLAAKAATNVYLDSRD